MTSGTDYYNQYGKANSAYMRGNLEEAVAIIEEMAQEFVEDPNVLLLRGHIYLSLQRYQEACEQYQQVLQLSEQQELIDYAQRGLQQAQHFLTHPPEPEFASADTQGIVVGNSAVSSNEDSEDSGFSSSWQENGEPSAWDSSYIDSLDWDSEVFTEEDMGEPTLGQSQPFINPFENEADETTYKPSSPKNLPDFEDYDHNLAEEENTNFQWTDSADSPSQALADFVDEDNNEVATNFDNFDDLDKDVETGDSTFVVSANLEGISGSSLKSSPENLEEASFHEHPIARKESEQEKSSLDNSWDNPDFAEDNNLSDYDRDQFIDNLDGLNDDDLEGLSEFDVTDIAESLPDSAITNADSDSSLILEDAQENLSQDNSISQINWTDAGDNSISKVIPMAEPYLKPIVEIEQGRLANFLNLSLWKKQLLISAGAGLTSILAIFLISSTTLIFSSQNSRENPETIAEQTTQVTETETPPEPEELEPEASPPVAAVLSPFSKPMLWMMLLTGSSTFGVTFFFSYIATSQMKESINDLQTQFDSIYQGDFNVKATVYSQDELGLLSTRFNQMAQVILTTTSDAQRRATETEKAKEDLQRQVIRLLDDVEGAARGDLTVEAEVTADVLGAVADAFNLTIDSLREIVLQVKKAAEQVNKSSTDSELFARNQSSDALRMAEELAVTLNSVQMMTESIQRVAENAREAEEVARSSSVTALKGGESVERTVAGILQIRETVSETARKVKRLAEASQEISKIVAVISQIASRTNLLALNASIQAARAGEAGRGFAIVADEVRQLADRSAKSLKDIEQIVLQIQSETGSVMTAMEEGIQQVIDVTERSEQAKRSLEDIIQVANRIDTLVRSITADTVRQRENSREVAQVMQSVELTAQETSQESQRVGGSLQKLVKISRDLLESVERFKVDKNA